MLKSSLLRYASIAVLLLTVATPSMARPPHEHPRHPLEHHRQPSRHFYDAASLPSAASLLLISGITYAVIDGLYYQRHNDKYVYVENPPVAQQQTIVSSHTGTVINALPSGSKTVTVNGVLYYVNVGTWYAPIASSHSFVIVEPQL